tara:strand:- start:78 stop:407 length:330 start_codon:yes stop_codon:yes gene_type:complete
MSQRINITYSIKLEDLDNEVRRLLHGAFQRLSEARDKHESLRSEDERVLTRECFDEIDGLRRTLSDVDVTLGDINTLIASYLSYEAQQVQPPPSRPDISSSDVIHEDSD